MKIINKLLTFFVSSFVIASSFSCGGGKNPPPEPPASTPTIVHANISEGDTIKFEYEGEDDLLVDWGDGTAEDAHSTEHTYSESKDDVKVEITGTITSIRFSSWSGFGENYRTIRSIELSDTIIELPLAAFNNLHNMSEIVISESIISIGDYAFSNCDGLNEINIPKSVISLGGENVFNIGSSDNFTIYCAAESKPEDWPENWNYNHPVYWDCLSHGEEDGFVYFNTNKGIKIIECNKRESTLDIPETLGGFPVTIIGKDVFNADVTYYYDYETINLPSSIKIIEDNAFNYCINLTSMLIPLATTTIGENVFSNCVNLGVIYCEAPSKPEGWSENWACDHAYYWDYVSHGEEKGFKYLITNQGSYVLGRTNTGDVINIPDTLGGKQVVGIYDNALEMCGNISSLTMPNSIKTIGKQAFYLTNLSSANVILPTSLLTIGVEAFYLCHSNSIVIPPKVTSIGASAFSLNNLSEISIPKSVVSIGASAFLAQQSGDIFAYCEAESKPDGWLEGWDSSIKRCFWGVVDHGTTDDLMYVVTNSGEAHVVSYSNQEGTEVDIPNKLGGKSVTELEKELFKGNATITSVKLPNTLKVIGDSAFNNCSKLATIDLTDFTDPFADLPDAPLNAFTDTNCTFNVTSKAMALSFAFEGGGWPVDPNRYSWPQ